ncbi:MAG: bifunctional riboflavin kinase/FAD synthetase [Nitrospirae bacterium]|nr:bifunctional riboflavin kinase/FAD synthetase [Nitrospirota bacterium]
MLVHRSLASVRRTLAGRRPVVTIGNFDGIHLGHQELFRRVIGESQRCKAPSLVMTFTPHPAEVLGRVPRLPRITPVAEKVRQVERQGIDHLFLLRFSRTVASLAPRAFVDRYLAGGLHAQAVIVGYDFFFGRGRRGNIDLLRRWAKPLGFRLDVVSPLRTHRHVVKSTMVRGLLLEGKVREAGSLLGRPYTFEGVVRPGRGLGRRIGFATANLSVDEYVVPADGVYAVWAIFPNATGAAGRRRPGVMNIGTNPTVGGRSRRIEVHILGWKRLLRGRRLRVEFLERLRGEKKFPSLKALSAQIQRDIRSARRVFPRYA